MYKTDVLIIGAGPVGLFTAFQAGMLSMKCHIVDSLAEIGGQCTALYPEKPIYDIPAYPKILAGDLIDRLYEQAKVFEPVLHMNQQLTYLTQEGDRFLTKTNKGTEIESKIVIIAAGNGAFGPNRPPLDGIENYEGKSIFYYVKRPDDFMGKKIAIAGGGDSAIDWAINLAPIAEQIYLIHRRDKFRAAPASLEKIAQIASTGKINLVTPYQLHSLEGSNGILSCVNLYDHENNIISLESDILLPFFGLANDLGPIRDWGLNYRSNHIMIDHTTSMTNIDGIYAIGDIATYEGKLKLILTGFAEAATALHHSYPRVSDGKALHFEHSTSMNIAAFK